MNVFEEHQLFIPIINDGRFAPKLRDMCEAQRPGSFKRASFDAMIVIQRENKLSVQSDNAVAVRAALWKYYTNQIKEERAAVAHTVSSTPFAETFKDRELREAITTLQVHASELLQQATILSTPKEEPIMSKAPAFETKHFVDGQDANTLSDEQLIHAIKRLETEIEALSQIKTQSKKIEAKITELNKQREAIAALLDSRP